MLIPRFACFSTRFLKSGCFTNDGNVMQVIMKYATKHVVEATIGHFLSYLLAEMSQWISQLQCC